MRSGTVDGSLDARDRDADPLPDSDSASCLLGPINTRRGLPPQLIMQKTNTKPTNFPAISSARIPGAQKPAAVSSSSSKLAFELEQEKAKVLPKPFVLERWELGGASSSDEEEEAAKRAAEARRQSKLKGGAPSKDKYIDEFEFLAKLKGMSLV